MVGAGPIGLSAIVFARLSGARTLVMDVNAERLAFVRDVMGVPDTLLVTGTEFTIIALIAVFLLIGIVKKNAIMMIDVALDAERTRGANPVDAIREACLVRFRPIMMTTMAALMGTLPIAFGAGAGAESRRPLGLAVAGGLLVSQLLTLYITPVIYTYLDRWSRKIAPKEHPSAVPAE